MSGIGEKLAGQMQRITSEDVYGVNGSMTEKVKAGSIGMGALQHDKDIIEYATRLDPEGVAAARKEFYASNPKTAPFELPRHQTSLAITYAIQGRSDDPKEQALMNKIAKKAEGVHDNPYLRQNCYAFAVEGANLRDANPIGLGAVPGSVTMGKDALDGKTDGATIIDRVTKDGAIPAGSDPSKLDIPAGMRLVAMYEDPGHDYHFNRIDISADGKSIAMTGKDGIRGHESEMLQRDYPIAEAFNEANGKQNVMHYSQKYEFRQFFYVPQEGLNVGMDAHLIKNGTIEPMGKDETPKDYAKRVDVAYHDEMQRAGPVIAPPEAAPTTIAPAIATPPTAAAITPVENTPLAATQLRQELAGAEPMTGALSGQKESGGLWNKLVALFSGPNTPSQESSLQQQQAQKLQQEQVMQRQMQMSGPGLSMN